jgi:hypothetical protein
MNRADFFLLCVQTVVLKDPFAAPDALRVLSEASRLPEEALGTEDIAMAAVQFVRWVKGRSAVANPTRTMPPWLAAWHEGQRNRCIVRFNDTPNAQRWWAGAEEEFHSALDRLGEGEPLPIADACAALIAGRAGEVEVTREQAETFQRWVERIPGHEEQPFTYEYPGEHA